LFDDIEKILINDTELKEKVIEIPDEFVVGYGMDYNQQYRNLPFIGILKEEILNQD